MPDAPTPIVLPVDRLRAGVHGLWLLSGSVLLFGFAYLVKQNVNPALLWKTQRLVYLVGAAFLLMLAVVGLVLTFQGLKWLLLSFWTGRLAIEITPDSIVLNLGPFGSETYDWGRIQVALGQGFAPDMLDDLPDDALLPTMSHPAAPEDIPSRIQRFSGMEAEELAGRMRPYLSWYFNARS